MVITAEQRQDRRRYIGASEVAAVCGLSPYSTLADLYAMKVMGATKRETSAMRAGNDYEDTLINYGVSQIQEHAGKEIFEVQVNPEFSQKGIPGKQAPITAHLDGLVTLSGSKQRVVLEAKVTRILEDYGKPWTDEIPAHVLCQVTAQMHLSATTLAFVVVMTREPAFKMYKVKYDSEIWKLINKQCSDFWWGNVVPQVQPEGEICLELLERVERFEEDNVLELTGAEAEVFVQEVGNWEQGKVEANLAKKSMEVKKSAVLSRMGQYSVVRAGDLMVEMPVNGRKVLKVHR